jgi:hypothetical protein
LPQDKDEQKSWLVEFYNASVWTLNFFSKEVAAIFLLVHALWLALLILIVLHGSRVMCEGHEQRLTL